MVRAGVSPDCLPSIARTGRSSAVRRKEGTSAVAIVVSIPSAVTVRSLRSTPALLTRTAKQAGRCRRGESKALTVQGYTPCTGRPLSSQSAANCLTALTSETSTTWRETSSLPLRRRTSATAASPRSRLRQSMCTLARRDANATDVASPRPVFAPVTKHTLPVISRSSLSSGDRLWRSDGVAGRICHLHS